MFFETFHRILQLRHFSQNGSVFRLELSDASFVRFGEFHHALDILLELLPRSLAHLARPRAGQVLCEALVDEVEDVRGHPGARHGVIPQGAGGALDRAGLVSGALVGSLLADRAIIFSHVAGKSLQVGQFLKHVL